jgi:hypothetical protein
MGKHRVLPISIQWSPDPNLSTKENRSAYMKVRNRALIAAGLCVTCASPHVQLGKWQCQSCRDKILLSRKKISKCKTCGAEIPARNSFCSIHKVKDSANLRKRKHARTAQGMCHYCGKRPRNSTLKCDYCREQARVSSLEGARKERVAALALYGNKCVCCGETEAKFLSFDHINNDGSKQRKAGIPTLGRAFHTYLLRKQPKDIQILCYNCNCAKGFYGICPHEKARQEAMWQSSKIHLISEKPTGTTAS